MPDPNEKARAAVERLFKKNPKATTAEFQEAAAEHDASVKKFDARSFHARYVLALKRAASGGRKRANKKARRKTPRRAVARGGPREVRIGDSQRTALRQLILARDKQVVKTLSGSNAQAAYELGAELDAYIDQLVRAARGR